MNYRINVISAQVSAVEDAVDGKEVFGLFSQAKAQLIVSLQSQMEGLKRVVKAVRGMKEKDAYGRPGEGGGA